MSRKTLKRRRVVTWFLLFAIMVTMLSGCTTGTTVSEDMIPTVTDLGADDEEDTATATASTLGLSMNSSYLAELTRLDGDNTETSASVEEVVLVLKATSMVQDLKVKVVNENTDKVVTGTAFEISVTDSEGTTADYTDSDEDGIIYIESIVGGSCTVTLTYAGSYDIPDSLTTTVSSSLSYSVVDVSDEIKSESEIDVSSEDSDTSGNDSAGTSTTLTDTVESVESTKTEITETTTEQEVDEFGQLVYSKLKVDEYGNEMYATILKYVYHTDSNGDSKCDYCGVTLTDHTHSYTSKTTTAATCTTTGVKTYTCTCGESYTETIAATGHTDSDGDGVCDTCGTTVSTNSDSSTEDTTDGSTDTSTDTTATSTSKATVKSVRQITLSATTSDICYIVYDTTSAPVYDTTSDPVYVTVTTVTGYKYTGWQTIDGKTYYYDADGNYVTGTQVIDGIQYTFSSSGVRSGTIGIDVSKYQSSINWTKVANAGIDFVMIRCGYRGYGSGVLVQDPMFVSHITGAKAAGLRVGIYFFSQAITEAEAVEEASMAVKLANQYGIDLPIAIDSEYANGGAGRADGLSKSARTAITIAFCKTVTSAGYKAMIYASKSWFSEHLDVSQFSSSYYIWVAHYATTCGYTGRYEMWQNTSKGSVDGISGNVDMNISSI